MAALAVEVDVGILGSLPGVSVALQRIVFLCGDRCGRAVGHVEVRCGEVGRRHAGQGDGAPERGVRDRRVAPDLRDGEVRIRDRLLDHAEVDRVVVLVEIGDRVVARVLDEHERVPHRFRP